MNEDLEFSTTLSLSETDKRYQALYVTHLYGTLFILYGKFTVKKVGDKMKIEGIELLGVNYKGHVNIGITGATVATDEVGKRLKLDLRVKAHNSGTFSKMTLNPDIELSAGFSLVVDRNLEPMNDLSDPLPGAAFSEGRFDSEFYERDGFFVKRKALPDFKPEDLMDYQSDRMVNEGMGTMEAIGRHCPIGFALISFT